jgi:hypothetical protein
MLKNNIIIFNAKLLILKNLNEKEGEIIEKKMKNTYYNKIINVIKK